MEAGTNVLFTGFMGAGKTHVALRCADNLGFDFYDMDPILEGRYGPIEKIFRKHGEGHFRIIERKLLREQLALKGVVISAGGGTLVDVSSREIAREKSIVIWLKVDYDVAAERIKNDKKGIKRPNADAKMLERFTFRQPLYEKAAHITVDANRPLDEVVADALRQLEQF